MKIFAQFISIVFHPCLIPTYAAAIMFYGLNNSVYELLTPNETKWRMTLLVFLFTGAFPSLSVFGLLFYRKISDIYLSERSERFLPYLAGALFYLFFFYFLSDIQIWDSLKLFILSSGITIVIALLINYRIKISAHALAIGGLLGFILGISQLIKLDVTLVYVSVIIAAGLIGWARLYLNAHQPKEFYLGFFVGLLIQISLFFMFQTSTFAYINAL